MVWILPLSSVVTGKHNTNTSATIIFLFIFLIKQKMILVKPTMHCTNSTVLTYNVSSGCSSYNGRGVINKTLGNSECTVAGIEFFFTKIEAHAGMA